METRSLSAAPVQSSSTNLRPLLLVGLVAVFGGFLFGYDTAVINGANQYLKAHFELDSMQEGMAGASAILGCIPGAMLAGFLSDRFGRRNVLFICAILYAASGLLSALPRSFVEFLAARFISGLGIGASSMICPVYVAEMAPKAWRGRLGSLFQFGIVSGIFLTLFINGRIQALGDEAWNAASGWRWMLGAEIAPALLLLAVLLFVQESPRWLLQVGREAAARRILETIGGAAHAQAEIDAVRSVQGQQEGGFFELFQARFRRPLLIAVLLMAVSQFSGINAIMYYSTKIFTTAGVGIKDSFTASALVGLVNLLFTFIAMALVDKAGRRPLLLVGLVAQVITLGTVGWMFHCGVQGVLLLVAIVAFIAAFAMALGPLPWILCSEIFPTRLRGRAMSVATFVIWSSCYIVAQTFPMLNDSPKLGPALTFGVYAGCSLLGLLFVLAMVPETKGKSLEEIEAGWTGKTKSSRPGSSALVLLAAAGLLACALNAATAQPAQTAQAAQQPAARRQPNLLFIVTDDQRWDALGVVQREQGAQARFPWFKTPNLDRLAAEGVRFRNAFVVHSLCSPSRATFLSGQYGHRNGIVDNTTAFSSQALNQAALLGQAGYRTAYIGKFHMGSQESRPGFDFIASYTGQGRYYGSSFLVNGTPSQPAGWVDDLATDYALEFIRTNQTNPWMMMLGFKACHTPRRPPERARSRFAGCAVLPAPNAQAKPPYGKGQLALREDQAPPYPEAVTDAAGSDEYLINYFRCISAADDNVGRILAELDTLKLASNTIVVFAGDNGYLLGEHGLGDKRAAYDESMRIPLLLRYPALGAGGRTLDELVLNIDLAPTFLDFAGLAVPPAMQGASWRPLLTRQPTQWRQAFMFEYLFEPNLPATPGMLAVRTPNAKLIVYPGHDAWTELFDLKSDPNELNNLAGVEAQSGLLDQLRGELERQKARFGNPWPEK